METRGVRVVQLEDISRDGEWLHLSLVSLAGETQSFVLHENDTWSVPGTLASVCRNEYMCLDFPSWF